MSDTGKVQAEKTPGWVQDPIEVTTSPSPAPDKPEKIEIEIVDDAAPADRGRPPRDPKVPPPVVTDDEVAKYGEKAQKRIKTLYYEYQEERRQKEAAAREKDEALRIAQHWQRENARLQEQSQARTQEFYQQAAAKAESDIGLAQQNLAYAIEAGKADEIAKAQRALSQVVADQAVTRAQAPRPVPQLQQQVVQQQPQQQFIPQPQTTAPDPRAVEWLKENPWFGTDEPMTGYAYGVHEKLVKQGVDPRSDKYYEEVNKAMKAVFPEEFDGGEKIAPAATRPNIVSPPARGSAPRKVQLTASQASVAKRLGLTLEQYATQLIKEQG